MDKKTKIYIGIFIVVLAGLMYADATKVKPVNWFPSYAAKDKIPYGTYILRQQLAQMLPQNKIREVHIAPYTLLQDTTVTGTYFFVNDKLNFGTEEFTELLQFVARGNDVFMATNEGSIDTLGLLTKEFILTDFEEKYALGLLNQNISHEAYLFDKPAKKIFFKEIDTATTVALGKIFATGEAQKTVSEGVNFVKHPFGKGTFYVHTFPLAFTNYSILKADNASYVSAALSYIDPKKPVLWDAYYKNGKTKISSPLYYVLSAVHLKWAYYFAIFGLVVFVIFKGKREQRYIPMVTPLRNQTLAFTQTIANLYYEKAAHTEIAHHKINYFLAYIRIKLNISTQKWDALFYRNLAAKSNNSTEDVQELFTTIKNMQQSTSISKEELMELTKKIEAFKTASTKPHN